MVIFGASGDLTKRKLIPALYNLAKDNLLSKEFALVGFARSNMTSEQFREKIGEEINQFATTKVDPDLWHWFSRRIYLRLRRLRRPGGLREAEDPARGKWTGTRDPRQLLLLPRHGPRIFWYHCPDSSARPTW